MCLFLYLKFKFASTYLFLFVSVTTYNTSALQLITQVLNVLVVSLCKPVIHKLKILHGKKLEYEKSIRGGGGHKNGGNQILKFQWRREQKGEPDF